LSRGYRRGWTLANYGKRYLGRNFSAGCIDVVNVSDTLPDNVVRTTIDAGFLVLVVGRNICVGALAQNLHWLPLHVQLESAADKQYLRIRRMSVPRYFASSRELGVRD
jgi:hypothetical protein